MHNVSEHFICIPLRFPCRPWLYRKLSQWLINCAGRSMREPGARGVSGYSQCLLRDGEHFSRENKRSSVTRNSTPILLAWEQSVFNQNAVMASIITSQEMAHVQHTYLLEPKRQLICSLFAFFSTFHRSATGH